jgi:copper chaperone CopZ
MKTLLFALLMVFGTTVQAQVTKVSLQASGLTCSMCSKAVKNALDKVANVDKVQVDIKNQQYNISFKDKETVDFDALSKAVEDAGFSIARLVVTANVDDAKLEKDSHIKLGGSYFHFLNAAGQQVNGETSFAIVDRKFVSAKEFKKYSGLTKMECLQTGRSAKCCPGSLPGQTRIYHAII